MERRRAKALQALQALNERVYAPFPPFQVEWEGRTIPKGFGPPLRRLRAVRDAESRVLDPEHAVEAFLFHYRLGIHYGYPGCCVLQYAMEAPYLPPLQMRHGITISGYVPCDACLERLLLDYINDGPEWQAVSGPASQVE